jgi:indolepyruvate ferredoxin oxidoreductase beta subunit
VRWFPSLAGELSDQLSLRKDQAQLPFGPPVEGRVRRDPSEEERAMIVRYQEFTDRNSLSDLSAPRTVALVGVGGQGVSLAADILHEAAQLAGFEAALLEIYSIGRCGGRVRCQVTLADRTGGEDSPVASAEDGIDCLVAFEMKSGLEALADLHPQGVALVHRRWLDAKGRPDRATALEDFQQLEPADDKTLPAYLLGALSRHLPIGDGAWREALAHHLPGKLYVEALEVFEAGASLATSIA